jgi:hypothetical protein
MTCLSAAMRASLERAVRVKMGTGFVERRFRLGTFVRLDSADAWNQTAPLLKE